MFDPSFARLYIADFGNNRIRSLDVATGLVTTFVGSGATTFANGVGTAASMNAPAFLCFDAAGATMYVTDSGANRVRRIDMASATVTTLAGSGTSATVNGVGAQASFKMLRQLALDPAQALLYVAEYGGHVVRAIELATGNVSTLAGSGAAASVDGLGTSASINGPDGIAVDAGGNVIVAAFGGTNVRRITPRGFVTTLGGSETPGYAEGAAAAMRFRQPLGLALGRQARSSSQTPATSACAGCRRRLRRLSASPRPSAATARCGAASWRPSTRPRARWRSTWTARLPRARRAFRCSRPTARPRPCPWAADRSTPRAWRARSRTCASLRAR